MADRWPTGLGGGEGSDLHSGLVEQREEEVEGVHGAGQVQAAIWKKARGNEGMLDVQSLTYLLSFSSAFSIQAVAAGSAPETSIKM